MGLLPAPFLERSFAPGIAPARRTGSIALLGAAFAFCWSPCFGTILASILLLASTGGEPGQAAVLLTAYSVGLAVPFVAVAVAGSCSWGSGSRSSSTACCG
jgi:cytochrome c-type biogenesis protein